MVFENPLSRHSFGLASIIGLHTVICCITLFYVSFLHNYFHIPFDQTRLLGAIAVVAPFAVLSAAMFLVARFSFGYFVAYYFYAMIAGYLWINHFTDLSYNHNLAGLSAAASALAFFIPALFYTSPARRIWEVSPLIFNRLLVAIVLLALATIAIGATYNFRIIGMGNFAEFREELFHAHLRNQLRTPPLIGYMVGITSNALLPFVFAYAFFRNQYWYAAGIVLLLLLYFPITLSKLSLFTPVWLVAIALLAKFCEARIAVVLSLLLPMLSGLIIVSFFRVSGIPFFDILNFRMMAIPSNSLNVYNHYFSDHELTYFCQIGVLKSLLTCPYQEQLGVLLKRVYGFGNYNASLFATEGIASVGVIFAPLAAALCGLVVSLGNRLSAGLPSRMVLVSSSILAQVFLNVPLSTSLLTYGTAVLFLLWYVTPRTAVVET